MLEPQMGGIAGVRTERSPKTPLSQPTTTTTACATSWPRNGLNASTWKGLSSHAAHVGSVRPGSRKGWFSLRNTGVVPLPPRAPPLTTGRLLALRHSMGHRIHGRITWKNGFPRVCATMPHMAGSTCVLQGLWIVACCTTCGNFSRGCFVCAQRATLERSCFSKHTCPAEA